MADLDEALHGCDPGGLDLVAAVTAECGVLLQPDGSYRLTAELAARDPQRRDIKQALRYLGTLSPAGKVSLVRTGRLPLEKFLGRPGSEK